MNWLDFFPSLPLSTQSLQPHWLTTPIWNGGTLVTLDHSNVLILCVGYVPPPSTIHLSFYVNDLGDSINYMTRINSFFFSFLWLSAPRALRTTRKNMLTSGCVYVFIVFGNKVWNMACQMVMLNVVKRQWGKQESCKRFQFSWGTKF